ncbi:hypothetical protein CLV84_0670 [Neolewinella xylanilytica]|uniref:Uncharacterized protein n=1 Tax=Neolewinella xylanilytica TaxID=1514080 RepID=A0A2S6I8A2_9BACT|nr:hypothetical protein [Neolewinella xylanilytica]PPK87720.1 hypothetical protein CLV84_0670 [Neolewinella xylanilytica]
MHKYHNLHRWMIIPFVVMQVGILRDYWGDFTDNAWSVHIHYWSGALWYLYLIIQPYYATHGQLERHRTNGIIGMFLAGGVCLTALSMMYRDINTAHLAAEMPDRFGPFEPWFFYGVASIEIPMILAFAGAVIMSILKRKQVDEHAWWLIATVFIILQPAIGRGFQFVAIALGQDSWPDIDIITPVYLAQVVIIGLALLTARRYGKMNHPATLLIVAVNLYVCFLRPLGTSPAVQALLEGMIKG